MNCGCHDEPMLWNRDARYRAGGFWKCRVKARELFRRWYAKDDNAERVQQRQRDRYDDDPIFRIEKRLADDARKRARTLKRRREHRGSLPE